MDLNTKKQHASAWFKDLRDQICKEFETIEPNGITFERTLWDRDNSDKPNTSGSILQGGGEMSIMIWFVVVSMIVGFGLKGPLGVEI